MALLNLRPAEAVQWDLVALGEVMLRLDPGEERIHTTRRFRAWEGGGEYNVARSLVRVFGLRTAIVTALVRNPVGDLIDDLLRQGGVERLYVRWLPFDGVGRTARNGLNFTERGFGARGAVGMYDRGHTAAAQMDAGDVDWETIFGVDGARWFHTGGIYAALSETTPAVIEKAMEAARGNGTVVSYDLNYRPSLWRAIGGQERAREINRRLVAHADVLFGNEEDFDAALGYNVPGTDENLLDLDPRRFGRMIERVAGDHPQLRLVATSLRAVRSASRNDWGAVCWADGRIHEGTRQSDLEILDRVGGGDAFAAGLIYALLAGKGPAEAVEYGASAGALAMTTPGDGSMATLDEVERRVAGSAPRARR